MTNHLGCAFEIAGCHMADESGDIDMHRASRHTSRILAVKTTRGFKLSLFGIISEAYFFKIGCPNFGVLFANRHSGYSISHYTYIYEFRD